MITHPKDPTPEGCVLTAHWSGDGWALCVEDREEDGDVVAYLAWPNVWPKSISEEDLRMFGFQIV